MSRLSYYKADGAYGIAVCHFRPCHIGVLGLLMLGYSVGVTVLDGWLASCCPMPCIAHLSHNNTLFRMHYTWPTAPTLYYLAYNTHTLT